MNLIIEDSSFDIEPTGVSVISLFPFIEVALIALAVILTIYWCLKFFRNKKKTEKGTAALWTIGFCSFVLLAAFFGARYGIDGYPLPTLYFLLFTFGMSLKTNQRKARVIWGILLLLLTPALLYKEFDKSIKFIIPLPFTEHCLDLFPPNEEFNCIWRNGISYSIF